MSLEAAATVYGGVQMRSRLEARWAAFFDLCGWRWRYEPFEMNGWTPDFELTTPGESFSVLVEVKPICWIGEPEPHWFAELDHPKIQKIHGRKQHVLVLGAYPAGEWNSSFAFPGLGVWQTPYEGRAVADFQIVEGEFGIPVFHGRPRMYAPQRGTLSKLWIETLARTRTHSPKEKIVMRETNGFWHGATQGGRVDVNAW